MRILLGISALTCLLLLGCQPTDVAQSGGASNSSSASSLTTDSAEMGMGTTEPAELPATGEAITPEPSTGEATTESTTVPTTGEAPAVADPAEGTSVEAAAATPVALADGVATLSPANTKIQFTGTHSGDKPDPRVGTFAKFSGEAKVDASAKTLQSVTLEIDTASLSTPIEKLTTHLQSEDFFDVREYPTAKFESTEITEADGKATIKGNLTLHGQTKEISFPASVSVTDKGLSLTSNFEIKRSEFGMDFSLDKVDDKVALSVAIGEATKAP